MISPVLKSKDKDLKNQILDSDLVSEDGLFVTEEEYWEKYYEHPDFNYEWNNGILEEKPVSDYINHEMYQWFVFILKLYFQTYKVGKFVEHDFGFRLALPQNALIRKPDLAVVLVNNPTNLEQNDRSFRGTYDLCVELISDMTPKAIIRDTIGKKMEYETIGVKEYYILDASYKNMAFYRLNQRGIFQPIKLIDDDILQSEVLKGFQFRVSDLFKQPSIEELCEDKIYYNYVLPSFRMIKQIADTEKQRAEMEKQRADRLAAKLRALGISVDE